VVFPLPQLAHFGHVDAGAHRALARYIPRDRQTVVDQIVALVIMLDAAQEVVRCVGHVEVLSSVHHVLLLGAVGEGMKSTHSHFDRDNKEHQRHGMIYIYMCVYVCNT
jgi:hypothetical protein